MDKAIKKKKKELNAKCRIYSGNVGHSATSESKMTWNLAKKQK